MCPHKSPASAKSVYVISRVSRSYNAQASWFYEFQFGADKEMRKILQIGNHFTGALANFVALEKLKKRCKEI